MSRVYHVHAKDTELFSDELYEYGTRAEATPSARRRALAGRSGATRFQVTA